MLLILVVIDIFELLFSCMTVLNYIFECLYNALRYIIPHIWLYTIQYPWVDTIRWLLLRITVMRYLTRWWLRIVRHLIISFDAGYLE